MGKSKRTNASEFVASCFSPLQVLRVTVDLILYPLKKLMSNSPLRSFHSDWLYTTAGIVGFMPSNKPVSILNKVTMASQCTHVLVWSKSSSVNSGCASVKTCSWHWSTEDHTFWQGSLTPKKMQCAWNVQKKSTVSTPKSDFFLWKENLIYNTAVQLYLDFRVILDLVPEHGFNVNSCIDNSFWQTFDILTSNKVPESRIDFQGIQNIGHVVEGSRTIRVGRGDTLKHYNCSIHDNQPISTLLSLPPEIESCLPACFLTWRRLSVL